jgi:ribose transport system permease protein
MFIIHGLSLLILPKPGGRIGAELVTFLTGDAIAGVLPAPVVVLLVALLIWRVIKRSRLGTGIYAVGSDAEAAFANGIRVDRVQFWTYLIAGGYYGAAGVFLGAVTGSGDPLVGEPMLMPIFAAVVLGGTILGGGRGGAVGTVFGAYTLMLIGNVLLVMNVSAYYATIAEAAVIILAVAGASISRKSPLAAQLRSLQLKYKAWRLGMSPALAAINLPRVSMVSAEHRLRTNEELTGPPWQRWLRRNRELVKQLAPSFALALTAVLATFLMFGWEVVSINYINSLLVLTSFLAILGMGQGAVILAGGFDLSVPWTITFCAMVMANLSGGSNEGLIYGVPIALGLGVLIGAVNGLGVVALGLPAIIMTLSMDGLLHGAALVFTQGQPTLSGAPGLKWFVGSKLLGISPTVWFFGLFVIASTLLLSRTAFGRRIYAVGCSPQVARMSGVNVARTQLGVFMLSGFCSALTGILLVGFGSQAVLGMGNIYMLPAVAVVIVGGTLVTGGRGHYLGTLGGALLLTSLGIMLAGTTWPEATREILIGIVVMIAILTLREKHA